MEAVYWDCQATLLHRPDLFVLLSSSSQLPNNLRLGKVLFKLFIC